MKYFSLHLCHLFISNSNHIRPVNTSNHIEIINSLLCADCSPLSTCSLGLFSVGWLLISGWHNALVETNASHAAHAFFTHVWEKNRLYPTWMRQENVISAFSFPVWTCQVILLCNVISHYQNHSGAAGRVVTSQCMIRRFDPGLGCCLCDVFSFFLCFLHSSCIPKKCELGDIRKDVG